MSDGQRPSKRGVRRAALRRRFRDAVKRFRPNTGTIGDETVEIQFLDADGVELATICASPGISLLALASKAGIEIDHFCGGQCSCGTCRVIVGDGSNRLSKMAGMEQMVLGAKHVSNGCRLACQARAEGSVTIQVPRWF